MNIDKILEEIYYLDGDLYWKKRAPKRSLDKPAGCLNSQGYKVIRIFGKLEYQHRIIFLMHNGYLPDFVDHIDCNTSNNKIDNLREASRSENQRNRRVQSNSKSGIKGVSWSSADNKWKSQVCVKGKTLYQGLFDDKDIASVFVSCWRDWLHGDFARSN